MTDARPTRQRLLLAFAKLRREAGSKATKGPSIASVAREVGVSHTLIHTKYPDIADKIRDANGRGPKQRLVEEQARLRQVEGRVEELKSELAAEKQLNRGLASENGRLTLLVLRLQKEIAMVASGVHVLRPSSNIDKPEPDDT